MKPRILCVAIAALMAAPSHAAEWWWVGLNGDAPGRVVTYVDRESVATAKNGDIVVWTLAIGESMLPNGQQHAANGYGIRCRQRQLALLSFIGYDPNGERLPLADIEPHEFGPIVPGSVGESVLNLVCGRPSGMEVRVDDPFAHGARFLAGQSQAAADPAPGARQERGLSTGTGFFVGPGGHVLTSFHVVEGADRIACRTTDGRVHEARVARISPANDLALLQVNLRPARFLSFALPGELRTGDRVFTIGYAAPSVLGISEPRFTDGTVSALSGEGGENAYVQISVPVQPGNSGGPLLNEAGQVVGIIAAQAAVEEFMRATGTLPQNVNWAVKAEYATPLMAPLPVQPRRTREQAIELARSSVCLIIAEGGSG